MEHATNEQMALVMGWHRAEGGPILYTDDGHYANFALWGFKYQWTWNPIENLNHAALVEQRLRELKLQNEYIEALRRFILKEIAPHLTDAMTVATIHLVTASAQTRCDAAWATWQTWQQREKE